MPEGISVAGTAGRAVVDMLDYDSGATVSSATWCGPRRL